MFTKSKKKLLAILVPFLILGLLMSGCSSKGDTVLIGSKNFTESRLLANMFKILVENNTDIKAEVKEFGSTSLVFEALKANKIDLYPEYTGTAYTAILNKKAISDAEETYRVVKEEYKEQFNLVWLGQLGINNTYTLTVREETATQLGLKTISDLKKHDSDLVLGCTMEFLERPDGYPGLSEHYGLQFKEARGLDPGLTYSAVNTKNVDVIDAFSTDGRIPAFNLVVLEDDLNFFPPYYAVPLIREETLSQYPDLEQLLLKLENQITDKEMQEMNYAIDELERDIEDVATEFLQEKGLI
jgi:glycine betaine/choline ABC-type transport system substrate-binding protein